MSIKRMSILILAGFFSATAVVGAANAQSDPQAGAQSGEQKALAGQENNASTTTAGTAKAGDNTGLLASGTTFNAELTGALDSKKAKPGDPVNARTAEDVKSGGKVILPKGTKLAGHVTAATSRAKEQADSTLGLVIDKAMLKNGQEIPLSVAIQALGPAPTMASPNEDMDSRNGPAGRSNSGNSTMGGVPATVGGASRPVTGAAGNAGGPASSTVDSTAGAAGGAATRTTGALGGDGQLTNDSRGVVGINGLSLNAVSAGSATGSVVTSSGKNVRLEGGTRLLLVAGSSAGSKPATSDKEQATPETPRPTQGSTPSPDQKP